MQHQPKRIRTRPFPAREVYEALLAAFGPQRWWPARGPTEMMVGAVLVQNTAWSNTVRAIRNLEQAGALDWPALHRMTPARLAGLIRPAGYFNVKAKRLQHLASFMMERFEGRNEALFALPTAEMRAALLSVHGVGRETADSIVLYAAGRAQFVIDAYTRRMMDRHGWAPHGEPYDALAERFTRALPADPALYNEFHALLVALGKDLCRPRPRCRDCPLRAWPLSASGRAACAAARDRGHSSAIRRVRP